jgi:hypothetical protein
MTRVLSVAAVFAVALATSAKAQELPSVVDRVAAAWGRGDANGIVAFAARSGVSLDVDGDPVGPLGTRQAAAVLRRLFDNHETVNATTGRAKVVGGSPEKGFGEISWTARVRGTSIPERSSVFIALVREDDRWRITEIRVMR